MSPQAQAEDAIPNSPIVSAKLVVDAPDAAVVFAIPEHWHIYWKNPGDTGIPTTFTWTLPDGLKAGEIEWPAPERIEISGLVNYGYSNAVTLPVKLAGEAKGDVKVKANWLVCKDICIPESAELSAPLAADAAAAKAIAEARSLVPTRFEGNAVYDMNATQVTIAFTQAEPWGNITAVRFSPAEDGIVANNPAPTFTLTNEKLVLTFAKGTAEMIPQWPGVLHLTRDGKETAQDVTVNYIEQPELFGHTSPAVEKPVVEVVPPSLLAALLLAFLGGLILNIMPCVLPILALKALALSKKAAASRAAAAKQGVSYTAGVVVSFLLIAAVMIALKATGSVIGWGFQLQNPVFVGFLALVMVLVSANLFGLFELPVLFGEKATGVDDSKLSGSFLTGVLAVLVATPCTAPFMATAIGATLSMPTAQALAVFAVLGLGMASPFLLISIWPAARRLLPKPGAWMHRFKQILAVPMLATAIWLIWVLMQIVNPSPAMPYGMSEPYSAARLSDLREQKKPVLVDATAAWCLSCKVNERVALKPAEMQAFFKEKNVTILVADWTTSDAAITDYLALFGRNGVPLYVYYAPGAEPVVLPQVLTPGIVRAAIEK